MIDNKILIKIFALVTFIGMITINALANILPINGLTTGKVSDSYPNLFAPAGVTFSIWGLIYLLLFIYIIYQFIPQKAKKEDLISKINTYFIISSIVNSVWIFSWHYQLIGLSVILMLILLFTLIKISQLNSSQPLSLKDRLFLKIPFGIYFGWITIATIANITTLLVDMGWKNFIFPDQIWMIIVLLVGIAIASIATHKQKNIAYGLVPVWAYFGIYLKHTSPNGFNNMYPLVINTVLFCTALLLISNAILIVRKKTI